MISNGFYIRSPHNFNMSMLTMSYPWILLESSFFDNISNLVPEKLYQMNCLDRRKFTNFLQEVCFILQNMN